MVLLKRSMRRSNTDFLVLALTYTEYLCLALSCGKFEIKHYCQIDIGCEFYLGQENGFLFHFFRRTS